MKMKRLVIGRLFCVSVLCAITGSCSHDTENGVSELLTPSSISYSAQCQTDTIRFNTAGRWSVAVDSSWVTIEGQDGIGNGIIPLYIQQNDGGEDRKATITVNIENGASLSISLVQSDSDLNGGGEMADLVKNNGVVGWGYDYKVDHADIFGIRGQIFDASKLKADYTYGAKSVGVENFTQTDFELVSEQGLESFKSSMSTALTGEVDLKVAGAKVSSEYSKQIQENKSRLFIWYREQRIVKNCFLNVSFNKKLMPLCFTANFRQAVKNLSRGGSVSEFVNKYGTHLIMESYLGGKFDYYFTVSHDVKESVETVITTVTVKFLCWKKSSTHVDEKVWSEVKEDFIGKFHVAGGGEKGKALNDALEITVNQGIPMMASDDDNHLIDDWQECFVDSNLARDDELTMVDFKVVPIWRVVELCDTESAKKIKNYIKNEYLK